MIRSLTNNFALSALEDNTSGPLNRRCTADLPSLRTLLEIRQKSWEPSFWEVMDSFVSVAYATLATSRTLLQWLPACLNLYIPNIYFVSANKKMISSYYGSCTSCWKPWRWVRFDLIHTMRDIYINSNLNPLTKLTSRV